MFERIHLDAHFLANLERVMGRLIETGRDPETPAACIERGTTSRQRVAVGTVATIARIADAQGLHAPVTTVVGDVAGLAQTRGRESRVVERQGVES